MKKTLIIIAAVLLVLGLHYRASAWVFVPDYGDSGWQTYTFTAGAEGFTGNVGFVVSNAVDSSAYCELLLDNLSQGGGVDGLNRGFEQVNFSGYDFLGNSIIAADVYESRTAASGTVYEPTEGYLMASLLALSLGIDTSGFHNASGQAGTVGAIMETAIALAPGAQFSFDWAFLGNDLAPWSDFALFYLKDPNTGLILFSDGLAQIGTAPVPVPPSLILLGSGLLGLLGLSRKAGSKQC
jgi:hypothetical protein